MRIQAAALLWSCTVVMASAATPLTTAPQTTHPAPPTPALTIQPYLPAADNVAQARTITVELGARLKAELQAAMQAGGPLAAISKCHASAAPVTSSLGEETGWEIGRTSLRIRNPDNAPDAWERSVLESFEKRAVAGEAPASLLEQQAVVAVGGHHYFRYMKAIQVAEPCTLCHGANVAPDVQAGIHALYPDDRATGYAPGELRGAFSLTRRID